MLLALWITLVYFQVIAASIICEYICIMCLYQIVEINLHILLFTLLKTCGMFFIFLFNLSMKMYYST